MSARSKAKSAPKLGWGRLVRMRPQVWAGLGLVAAMGVGGHLLWRQYAASIALDPRYQISPDEIVIPAAPPWVRSDIKSEVLRNARLPGNLSLLEDWEKLVERLRQAFEFHPWVATVDRITRTAPNGLKIELTYRRPLAAVESSGQGGVALLPIDAAAVRLPEADLTDAERRYLPRIADITGRPMIGDVWEDPRVIGGVKLIAALADVWQQLQLVEVRPSPHPTVRGDVRYYSYEMVTNGRTRIVWGAAPGEEQMAGESAIAAKRKRLLDYATTSGRLDSVHGPESVDVRTELVVTPRTARREDTPTR